MGAPLGNQFWKLRPRSGRKPKYDDSGQFALDIEEYFEVTSQRDDWNKQEWVGKDGIEVSRRVQTPFTQIGLCIFLGMSQDTFNSYKERGKDFLGVITYAEEVIYAQKYEGATTGHFSANIIARDLGLADKKEIDQKTIKIEIADGVDLGKLLGDE